MTTVTLRIRAGSAPETVDLDTLTPKARALAEAIHMSVGHQPLGVLCDTGLTKGDNPNHTLLHGSGPRADEIAGQPDHRFMTNLEPLPRHAVTGPQEWLEYNARQMPVYAWPIAGARSRIEALTERVPSADAARDDRCMTRDQALRHLADGGTALTGGAWIALQKAGNAPHPRHYALGGRMPLWHVDDLDAYRARDYERWTISTVAAYLGYTGPSANGSARRQLSRWGLGQVDRAPGRGGEGRFAADQVTALHTARPGRGRHGAQRSDGGRFTAEESDHAPNVQQPFPLPKGSAHE
ncbi:hypothetical protein SZN_09371 [Streptomyces zinciresistens K42]|uniref:Uncharacterized protein n=1 Tax=Streptomyces zinciresistens K42 TaxID=700597 RepID=G2G8Q6_9ACTN|nr:hypothetical protein [Streptomyces zinciresistens]EGX60121.1 hypothetical protein SZN_09371 [Streptomyces zinciresistens K42]